MRGLRSKQLRTIKEETLRIPYPEEDTTRGFHRATELIRGTLRLWQVKVSRSASERNGFPEKIMVSGICYERRYFA